MSLVHTVKAVLWSFIGIRKRSELESDMGGRLNPFAVIAVAFVLVLLFIAGLITLVHFVAN
ncbi:MAG TPA: DUF2970 domain-containing protein [Ramlibacter sp.]|nr:DUF2970 domain-containing protein [Ramlibacter sp.]